MTEKTKKTKKMETKKVISESCKDKNCPVHGNLKTRGRNFQGVVVTKHEKRVAIEFERMVYIRKYERYARKKSKMHARLPTCMERDINIGDMIRIKECRPLSKIIHFVVDEKIKSAEGLKK